MAFFRFTFCYWKDTYQDAGRMGKGSRKVGERMGVRMVKFNIFNCFRCLTLVLIEENLNLIKKIY
jgi:hypothetical protein